MKCLNETLIQQYIDGEMSRWQTWRVKRHLQHCKVCKNQVTEHQIKVDLVRAAFNEALPSGFTVPAWQPEERRKSTRLRWTIAGVAAATMAIIITTMFVGLAQKDESIYQNDTVKLMPESSYAQGNDWNQVFRSYNDKIYDIPIGDRKLMVVLPDESVIVSHANTDYYTLFDKNGKFVREFGLKNSSGQRMKNSKPIAGVLNSNTLYTKADNMGKIHFCDFNGNIKRTITIDFVADKILPLPNSKLLISGLSVGNTSKHVVAIYDYKNSTQKIIWGHVIEKFSKGNEDALFYYTARFDNGSTMNLDLNPASSITPKVQIAVVKGTIVVADPYNNQVITFDNNGTQLGKQDIPFGKKAMSVEEQKKILREHIARFKDSETQAAYMHLSVEVFNKVMKNVIQKMESDLNKISTPLPLPVFSTVIQDSDGNLLFFEISEDEGDHPFNVWVYQGGGEFVSRSHFVSDQYKLTVDPDKMVFHNGYLYGLQELKDTAGIPMRLVKFKLQ